MSLGSWVVCVAQAGGNTYEVFNAGAYKATKFAKQGACLPIVLPTVAF